MKKEVGGIEWEGEKEGEEEEESMGREERSGGRRKIRIQWH